MFSTRCCALLFLASTSYATEMYVVPLKQEKFGPIGIVKEGVAVNREENLIFRAPRVPGSSKEKALSVKDVKTEPLKVRESVLTLPEITVRGEILAPSLKFETEPVVLKPLSDDFDKKVSELKEQADQGQRE